VRQRATSGRALACRKPLLVLPPAHNTGWSYELDGTCVWRLRRRGAEAFAGALPAVAVAADPAAVTRRASAPQLPGKITAEVGGLNPVDRGDLVLASAAPRGLSGFHFGRAVPAVAVAADPAATTRRASAPQLPGEPAAEVGGVDPVDWGGLKFGVGGAAEPKRLPLRQRTARRCRCG
jgi:hypothetical protein